MLNPYISVMRKKTAALALVLAAPPAVRAEESSFGQKVDEAMQGAFNLMERVIGTIPGDKAPEIMPKGTIIIRRRLMQVPMLPMTSVCLTGSDGFRVSARS